MPDNHYDIINKSVIFISRLLKTKTSRLSKLLRFEFTLLNEYFKCFE